MESRRYWITIFTGTTWKEFLDAGGIVAGFTKRRIGTAKRMRIGDYLICYLAGLSSLIAVLEVISEGYEDHTPIWKDDRDDFPARVNVMSVITLTPETAIPILELRDELQIFRGLRDPNRWGGMFQAGPKMLTNSDGQLIVQRLIEAKENPQVRQIDAQKLARKRQKY